MKLIRQFCSPFILTSPFEKGPDHHIISSGHRPVDQDLGKTQLPLRRKQRGYSGMARSSIC